MVRINHAASYFMPMFCSSKPYVVILSTMATSLLFIAMYMTSHFLSKQYNDPNLFKPNSQDYFRTSLLGLFSPILYYFIKTFLLNINKRYLILNLLVDFPLNDWFILFIVICLAYPQIEQPSTTQETYMWHILPRQSYLFGIAWSLGEFIISVCSNLFNHLEVPHAGKVVTTGSNTIVNDNIFYEGNEDFDNDDTILPRDKITLSKCIGVRRNSSSISHNVYSAENDSKRTQHSHANDYGSLRQGENNSNLEDTLVMVDPTDNSLKLTSLDLEASASRASVEPTGRMKFLGGLNDGSRMLVKQFPPVQNKSDLFRGIGLLLLVLTSNILLTVGQSLITSIYFIYVPGHDGLFTSTVCYFGEKSIHYFLLVVIVPFTTLNFLVNGMIYIWRDMDGWFNTSTSSDTLTKSYSNSIRNYHDYYEAAPSLHRSRPGSIIVPDLASQGPSSLMLVPSPVEYPHHYGSNAEDYDSSSPKLLVFAKKLIGSWKRVAIKNSFVLTSMFVWGVVVFITGMKSTIVL